jgi:hypothetical protein
MSAPLLNSKLASPIAVSCSAAERSAALVMSAEAAAPEPVCFQLSVHAQLSNVSRLHSKNTLSDTTVSCCRRAKPKRYGSHAASGKDVEPGPSMRTQE